MRVRPHCFTLIAACAFGFSGCATIPTEPAVVSAERDRHHVEERHEAREVVADVERKRVQYTVVAPDGRSVQLVTPGDELSILHPLAPDEVGQNIVGKTPSANVLPLLPGRGIAHRP